MFFRVFEQDFPTTQNNPVVVVVGQFSHLEPPPFYTCAHLNDAAT